MELILSQNSNFRPGCFLSESEKDRVHGRGGRPSILKYTAIPTVFHHFGPPKKKRRAFENIDETPENLEVHVIFIEIVTLFLKLNQSGTTNCHQIYMFCRSNCLIKEFLS